MRHSRFISGWRFRAVELLILLQVTWITFRKYRDIHKTLNALKALMQRNRAFIGNNRRYKIAQIGGRYFINYGMPAWPSRAFSRFVENFLDKEDHPDRPVLNALLFGITKKCNFQCEHCFEWFNLNKKEVLSKEHIVEVIQRFRETGVATVHLSGGEPMNRFRDVLHVLKEAPQDIEYWIYSNGFSLDAEKARMLKEAGLTGVAISVDHYLVEMHDGFRGVKGSFERAMQAAENCHDVGLAVCFSLCATGDMTSSLSLHRYAKMARKHGVKMVQILEPKAVGHYAGRDVSLAPEEIRNLENFFLEMNFTRSDEHDFPLIAYHGYYGRKLGCQGAANGYVYVDTDGYVHSCPFCQQQLYHALEGDLTHSLSQHMNSGCRVFPSEFNKINDKKMLTI